MPSFKSILTGIYNVEHAVASVGGSFIPMLGAVDGIFTRVMGKMVSSEISNPTGPGASKAQSAMDDFEAGLELTRQIAAASGLDVQYDQEELKSGNDSFVVAMNHYAKVKASLKFVPIAHTDPTLKP